MKQQFSHNLDENVDSVDQNQTVRSVKSDLDHCETSCKERDKMKIIKTDILRLLI